MSERKLAAIMLTEFISQKTSGAIEFSEEKLFYLKSIIEDHSGRWSKYREGTYVSIFDSALDAVDAAREIMEESKNDSANTMRIGIHLGDVIIDPSEIQGDGIEITSKITSAAEPGSVLISDAVYGAVKGVGHIHARPMGEKILDDKGGTIRIYKLGSEQKKGVEGAKSWAKYMIPAILVMFVVALGIWQFTGTDKKELPKTILVLPFEFAEADSSNQHVADWVLTELIGNLGNANSLTVFNEATSNVFKASLSPIGDASNRLDQTDFFVKGSIKAELNQIIIDAKIFDREEVEIWSESYTKELDSLSWLTNKIAMDIIETLNVKLAVKEYRRIAELEPIETEQFELWAKASNQLSKGTPEGFANARIYLTEMVDNNSKSSRSWAKYAQGLISMGHSGYPPPGIWNEAREAAERALRYDSLNAEAWSALACSKTYGEQDFEGAVKAYEKANALNPNMGFNHYHYAWLLYLYDEMGDAIKEHTIAQELDPLFPGMTFWLAWLLVQNDNYEQAMEEAKRLVRITSDSSGYYYMAGFILFKQERYDSALYFVEKIRDEAVIATLKFRLGDIDPIMDFIQSMKDQPLNSGIAFQLAGLYAEIDSLDRFFEYANYEPPSYATPYFRKMITNPNVFRDPRFKELMMKFDLPMPEGYE